MHTLERDVRVATGDGITLDGTLALAERAREVVLFAHGSGSSRHSSRNRFVARTLQEHRLSTLLVDLLTPEEEQAERYTRHLRFDIGLLARRLIGATRWLRVEPATRDLVVGYFGASTGAAAALAAAAREPEGVSAIVSRGGRPDLAADDLPQVSAPTLLLVGGHDVPVIGVNRAALRLMHCEARLDIIPGATHLFEETGALERVAELAGDWFVHHQLPAGHELRF